MNAPAPTTAPAAACRLDALLADYAAAPALAIGGLTQDSREVVPGTVFLALNGLRSHGLAYAEQALARGAAAIVWEPAPGVAPPVTVVPTIAVPGLSAQVSAIAARYYGEPAAAMFVAAVTGTDGKTSTAHLIAQGFEALGRPCGYLGTIGQGRLGQLQAASHTTVDAVRVQQQLAALRDGGAEACAMEVSSHALDQHRVAGVRFAAAVLTNVGRDHLDYHGSVEAYAAAKQRLFTDYAAGALLLNQDDAHGAAWSAALAADPDSAARLSRYGLQIAACEGRYLYAEQVRSETDGLQLDLVSDAGRARLRSRLLGRFNAANLLAAAATLRAAAYPLDAVIAALAQARTVPGRMEAFRGPAAAATVVVDYAHTPQALRAALTALRPHVRGRLYCVFGCGGDRDRGKRPLMGAAAAELADVAFVTDDNPRSESPAAIVAEILAGVPAARRAAVQVEPARAAAIAAAVRAAGAGDLVLVAGKGHEDYQTYGSEVRSFSDRAYVAELLGTEPRT